MKITILSASALSLLLLFGCESNHHEVAPKSVTTKAATVAFVNANGVQQVIDGFGGSTAWSGQFTDAEANSLYSNGDNSQMGLSILRVRIDPSSTAWGDEKVNAEKAKARGAKIFATPWTPPASMKSNNNVVGGTLNTSQYAAYATHLKNFCTTLTNVDVISVQNEPNITVTYESCTWNATQLLNFVKNNAASIGKPILMPEAYNFDFTLSDPTLNDAAAAANLTYIGGHLYGTTVQKYNLALTKGKKTWMTEHYYDPTDIGTVMTAAKEIHDCMTVANHSAYLWWTLKSGNCAVLVSGVLNKKGYMLGQFAKYIRPGYNRIDATYGPNANIYVSAYKSGTKVVIVALNMGTTAFSQPFTLQNAATVTSVTPTTTSNTVNLTTGTAIAVTGGNFTASLPAQSITTFVSN